MSSLINLTEAEDAPTSDEPVPITESSHLQPVSNYHCPSQLTSVTASFHSTPG